MNLTLLKDCFAGFLRTRHIAGHFRRLALQALPSLYCVFLPLILLADMGLTQAVKGDCIRKFGWQ